jgi:hypothetical protein
MRFQLERQRKRICGYVRTGVPALVKTPVAEHASKPAMLFCTAGFFAQHQAKCTNLLTD